MNQLIPSFKQSIFNSPLPDAGTELLEIGIDSILDNEAVKQIPIVRTIIGLAETAQNIRDRNLMRNTCAFLTALRDGTLPQDTFNKHKQKLDSDPAFAEEELGRVLVILDSILDKEKAKLLAKIYQRYVKSDVSWQQFRELSEVIQKIFLADIDLLKNIHMGTVLDTTQCDSYRADRLAGLGLIGLSMKSVFIEPGANTPQTQNYLRVTELGKLLCDVIG